MSAEGSERGQRVYDRWASRTLLYGLVNRLTRQLRREAVAELDLERGDMAVDVGCGPGASLPLLHEAVGPRGRVVGLDYSTEMTRLARDRTASSTATSVVGGDARRLPLPDGSVDAALATPALSTVPEARAAATELRRVLGDGGRLAAFDARVPEGTVDRLLDTAYRRAVNWQGHDVSSVLGDGFPTVETVATYDAGLAVLLVASE